MTKPVQISKTQVSLLHLESNDSLLFFMRSCKIFVLSNSCSLTLGGFKLVLLITRSIGSILNYNTSPFY